VGLFGGGSRLIGIDIGASSIKVVAGQRVRTEFVVDRLAVVPLPFRSIDEQGVVNAEAVSQGINSALALLDLKKSNLATAVRGNGVLTKRIVIPKIPKAEIPEQVRWEAEQVFPVDVSSILVDYVLLGESDNVPGAPPGTPGWELLLVGARVEDAETYTNMVSAAGSKIVVMDLDAFAIGDFLSSLIELPKDEAVAFVDVGASATRIGVRHKGNVVFMREFPLGGNAFTETIAQTLGLSFDDAEALKIQDGSGIPQEAHEALSAAFQSWKTELQQCEDVFVSQDNTAVIARWVIFGGASQTPGLLESLQDERFASKVIPFIATSFIKAKPRSKVDPYLLQLWSARLVTAAALCERKA
jgi:type IV pilus assembly protein PilM